MKAGWRRATLGDICELRYGKALKDADRTGTGYPVYGSNGIVGHHHVPLTAGPTIVVGRKGSYGEINVSGVSCWPIDTTYFIDSSCTDEHLGWLGYRMAHLGLNRMNRAAAVPGLNRDDAYRQELLLPPIDEQRRIAAILDRADELRAKRRAARTHLDSLTQSIFLEMFGDPSENPFGWPMRPLIDLIDPDRPLTYGILMPGPHQPDGVPYVRVTDMTEGAVAHATVRRTTTAISATYRRSVLRAGDVLLSIRGHVGRMALIPPELDGANITQDSARLAVVGADSRYLMECLRTEGTQRWMQRRTKGVAVRGINLGDVKRMPIPVPVVARQHAFALKHRAVEAAIHAARQQAGDLDALFASLQDQGFSGAL